MSVLNDSQASGVFMRTNEACARILIHGDKYRPITYARDVRCPVLGEQTFLADTVEAIIAAIFIDSGYSYKKTKRCIRRLFKDELEKLEGDIS